MCTLITETIFDSPNISLGKKLASSLRTDVKFHLDKQIHSNDEWHNEWRMTENIQKFLGRLADVWLIYKKI